MYSRGRSPGEHKLPEGYEPIHPTEAEEVGHHIIRHDYNMTTRTYCVVIIACFRVQSTPSTFFCT